MRQVRRRNSEESRHKKGEKKSEGDEAEGENRSKTTRADEGWYSRMNRTCATATVRRGEKEGEKKGRKGGREGESNVARSLSLRLYTFSVSLIGLHSMR